MTSFPDRCPRCGAPRTMIDEGRAFYACGADTSGSAWIGVRTGKLAHPDTDGEIVREPHPAGFMSLASSIRTVLEYGPKPKECRCGVVIERPTARQKWCAECSRKVRNAKQRKLYRERG